MSAPTGTSDSPTSTSIPLPVPRSRRSSTHTHRSVRSVQGPGQRSWRSPSKSLLGKGVASPSVPSVSVVYAEPELDGRAREGTGVGRGKGRRSVSEYVAGAGSSSSVPLPIASSSSGSSASGSGSASLSPVKRAASISDRVSTGHSDNEREKYTTRSIGKGKMRELSVPLEWVEEADPVMRSTSLGSSAQLPAVMQLQGVGVPAPASTLTQGPQAQVHGEWPSPVPAPAATVTAGPSSPPPQFTNLSASQPSPSPSSLATTTAKIRAPSPIKPTTTPPRNIIQPSSSSHSAPPSPSPNTRHRKPTNKGSWFAAPPTPPPPPIILKMPKTPPPEYPSVMNLRESPGDMDAISGGDRKNDGNTTMSPAPAQQPPSISKAAEGPSTSPPTQHQRKTSLPSSIDDKVPSLPPTPPAHKVSGFTSTFTSASPSAAGKEQLEVKASIGALNSTASRFMLSIPLLGRAKVPLGSVMGEKEGNRKQGLNGKASSGSMKISSAEGSSQSRDLDSTATTSSDFTAITPNTSATTSASAISASASSSSATASSGAPAEAKETSFAEGPSSSTISSSSTSIPPQQAQVQGPSSTLPTSSPSPSQSVPTPTRTSQSSKLNPNSSSSSEPSSSSSPQDSNHNQPTSAADKEGEGTAQQQRREEEDLSLTAGTTTAISAISAPTSASALGWWEYMGWSSSSTSSSNAAVTTTNTAAMKTAGATPADDSMAAVNGSATEVPSQDPEEGVVASHDRPLNGDGDGDGGVEAEAEDKVQTQLGGGAGVQEEQPTILPAAVVEIEQAEKEEVKATTGEEAAVGSAINAATATTTSATTTTTTTATATVTANPSSSSGVTWLSPWMWYSTSSSASTAHRDRDRDQDEKANPGEGDQAEEGTTTASTKDEHEPAINEQNGVVGRDDDQQQQQETPARAEASALAAPEDTPLEVAPPPSPAPAPASAPAENNDTTHSSSNPILSTLTTHRAGWTSFFSSSSRGLIIKSLGYGATEKNKGAVSEGGTTEEQEEVRRDENGVEVMELDLDEDEEAEVELRKELGAAGVGMGVRGPESGEEERGRPVEAKKDVGSKPPTGSLTDASTITKVLAAVMPISKPLITASSAPTSTPASPKQGAFQSPPSGSGNSRPGSIKETSSEESGKSTSGGGSTTHPSGSSGAGAGAGVGKVVKHKSSKHAHAHAPPLRISADVKRSVSPGPQAIRGSSSGGGSKMGSRAGTPVPGQTPGQTLSAGETTFSPGSSVGSTTAAVTTTTTSSSVRTTKISTSNSSKEGPAKVPPSRTSSPAPSTSGSGSGSNSQKAPPPPNWVLPTWEHVFHTPPRSMVPPSLLEVLTKERKAGKVGKGDGEKGGEEKGGEEKGQRQGEDGGLLGKTMRFVSGVLLGGSSVQASAPSGSSALSGVLGGGGGGTKGKQRARSGSLSTSTSTSAAPGALALEEGRLSMLERERRERFNEFGRELPKAWKVLEDAVGGDVGGQGGSGAGAGTGSVEGAGAVKDVLRGCKRVVVIGVHGWFPGGMIRSVVGEPTGTSTKFANMTEQALWEFEKEYGVELEKITKIPLEGEGTIEKRVERLYANLKANAEWMSDLHAADAIFVSTHSQGSVVSTHLLDRLITDGHIVTSRNHHLQYMMSGERGLLPTGSQTEGVVEAVRVGLPIGMGAEAFPSAIGLPGDAGAGANESGEGQSKRRKLQRVCCLALCGIHLGPLRYLGASTLVGPYIQYFESTAARELFEFQNTESAVSKAYAKALENVLDHGTKIVYIASLNDQVVPIYSGLFTAVSHPLILRALYIDGDAYHSSDFLSNLLVLLLRLLNSGMSDSGLITHLSEATAGSLNGIGHSTAYEELATYSLAVKYLFLTNDGMAENSKLTVEPFNAASEQNDYEIPWSLRDIIADERVTHFFGREISELRDAFREWHPKTSILRDLKRKLQPITRLPPSGGSSTGGYSGLGSVGTSKL